MIKRPRVIVMPEFGLIKGGRLNGWRFHFLRFKIRPPADVLVLARCTPPNWPFPWDIELDETHFSVLRAVRGERAKRMPALPLIRRAFVDALLPVPDWLKTSEPDRPRTLHGAVERSRNPPAPLGPWTAPAGELWRTTE